MLRPYQIKAINEIEQSKEKNICLQMPTGSGKTFTFTQIAKNFAQFEAKRVLILVHREELLKQAKNSLGEACFLISKGVKMIPSDFTYYVGMVETLKRRLNKLPEFGLVIIDECHIGNFSKLPFFDDANTKVIGVSATPFAKKPLSKLYQKLIQPVQIDELINDNYLVESEVYAFGSDDFVKSNIKVKNGEFDNKQMEEAYSSEKMVNNVIEAYWKHTAGYKTMIFNVNIEHSLEVTRRLQLEGLNVYHVDGTTPEKERNEIVEAFKNESDAILCNVGVFTTGFDEPTVKAIFLNRATMSINLYLQMVGRGARICEGKDKFKVIDLGKNTLRHGFYEDYRDWNAMFKQGSEGKGGGVAPIKECPDCGFIDNVRKLVCTNCGHDYAEERKKQQEEERVVELKRLVRDKPLNIDISGMIGYAKNKGYKPYQVLHRVADNVIKYQEKHKGIATVEDVIGMTNGYVLEFCKSINKTNPRQIKWHKDLLNNLIKDKIKKHDQ